MDMGTGKTRTMLEIIKDKYNKGKIKKIIWFCPCSAKENIKHELGKHLKTGHEAFIIAGIESLSSSVRLNSYLLDFVINNKTLLVIDESNLVKNPMAKRSQNLERLSKFCEYKYILNGTPVTRDERDLYGQWKILDWRILGYRSYWSFASNHAVFDKYNPQRFMYTKNVEYLTKKIAPYSYQIKKDECLDLPEKVYATKYFSLDDEQYAMYWRCSQELIAQLDDFIPETIYRLFSVLSRVASGFQIEVSYDETTVLSYKDTPEDNPRLEFLQHEVAKYDKDEKIIIYCVYTKEVENIVKMLNKEYGEGSALPYYGELNNTERNENIKKFKNEARFLVANKTCASYSLNLQFCHNIIYFNNDWDYGTRSQSEDRIHRIGQEKKATYLDIVASNTLDETIIKCLENKEGLVESLKKALDKDKDKNSKKVIEEFINLKGKKGKKGKNMGKELIRVYGENNG